MKKIVEHGTKYLDTYHVANAICVDYDNFISTE